MSDSFVTPWTVAHQAPLSMGFLRQEYWSGLPFPSPGDLANPGTEPTSPALQADSLPPSHLQRPTIGEKALIDPEDGTLCVCCPYGYCSDPRTFGRTGDRKEGYSLCAKVLWESAE